jgi:branched-chain amino acid transport system permease protein
MSKNATTAMRAVWPVLVPCALVAAVALIGYQGPASLQQTVLLGLVNVIFVVGLYAFVGTTGVFSFGHMSFAAVGAYMGALLTLSPAVKELRLDLPGVLQSAELDSLPAALLAGAAAAVFAALLAVPLMRLSGLTASLATVALLIVVYVVSSNWDAVTQGQSGLGGVPPGPGLGVTLAWALGAIVLVYAFQRSRIGLRLRASREDEIAARGVGVYVVRERIIAFVLSAFVVGIGGALFAGILGTVTPGQFYIGATFMVVAMLVVGGATSLGGAVLGAVTISVASELLQRVERSADVGGGLTQVGIALLLLGVLAWRPAGLMRGREFTLPRRRGGAGGRLTASVPSSGSQESTSG